MTIEYCIARGFESKDVEFQQAERERGRETRPALTPGQRAGASRCQTLELSLARLRADLERAQRPAHRSMHSAIRGWARASFH